jgi:hypothetical protein
MEVEVKNYHCEIHARILDAEECFDCARLGRGDRMASGRVECQKMHAKEVKE